MRFDVLVCCANHLRFRYFKLEVSKLRLELANSKSGDGVHRGNIIHLCVRALANVLGNAKKYVVKGFQMCGLIPLDPARFLKSAKLDLLGASEGLADVLEQKAADPQSVTLSDYEEQLAAAGEYALLFSCLLSAMSAVRAQAFCKNR